MVNGNIYVVEFGYDSIFDGNCCENMRCEFVRMGDTSLI